jgi:hypothetical protein
LEIPSVPFLSVSDFRVFAAEALSVLGPSNFASSYASALGMRQTKSAATATNDTRPNCTMADWYAQTKLMADSPLPTIDD